MSLPEGFQWEEFTRAVVSTWEADAAGALAELERVGRLGANISDGPGWWERSVFASEVFTPERLAWFMTALAIVGDASGFPGARVGYALTRARDEAGLAGTTLRALARPFSRTKGPPVEALGALLLRRARTIAASPPDTNPDAMARVLDLFADAVGESLTVEPKSTAQQPQPPEPLRTAGTPVATSALPRVTPEAPSAARPPYAVASARFDAGTLSPQQIRAEAARWLVPFSGEAPAGVDATYDERMQRVVERVNQLESAANDRSRTALWRDVARDADVLLTEVTRDLTLAAYLAHAMIHVEGATGLARGLALLVGLVEDHWATMFPPVARTKRRANAIVWYCDRTLVAVEWLRPRFNDGAAFRLSASLLEQLSASVRARLGDATPAFQPLRQAIARQVDLFAIEPT